ncbi:GlxA family transcriptional regulator [Jatrophihabitans endophyticus]
MRTVLFAVPPRVHLLDLAGPAQAFATANDHGGAYRLRYVSTSAEVVSHQGLPLSLDVDWPDLTDRDVVVVPGRRTGERPPRRWLDAGTATALRAHHAAGGRVASVCSGAFAVAETGLLDGRRATTHHEIQDELARRFPAVHVVRDVLYVADGRVATSAGIASGIDLALHLIGADHGPAVAGRVARSLVVPVRRNGAAPQASVMLRHRDHVVDTVHRVQDVLDTQFTRALPLRRLAEIGGVSERTLTRQFTAAVGMTPAHYQQQLRLERARQLAEQGWTLEASARSVGFTDARMLRRLRARHGFGG